jgi:hypothetical protein
MTAVADQDIGSFTAQSTQLKNESLGKVWVLDGGRQSLQSTVRKFVGLQKSSRWAVRGRDGMGHNGVRWSIGMQKEHSLWFSEGYEKLSKERAPQGCGLSESEDMSSSELSFGRMMAGSAAGKPRRTLSRRPNPWLRNPSLFIDYHRNCIPQMHFGRLNIDTMAREGSVGFAGQWTFRSTTPLPRRTYLAATSPCMKPWGWLERAGFFEVYEAWDDTPIARVNGCNKILLSVMHRRLQCHQNPCFWKPLHPQLQTASDKQPSQPSFQAADSTIAMGIPSQNPGQDET